MARSPGWRGHIHLQLSVPVFAAGLVLGGATAGAVLWFLGGLVRDLPEHARAGVLVVAAATLLAREVGLVSFPLPQNARQVPQSLMLRAPVRSTLQFGYELGTGARTFLTATAPYLVALAVLMLVDALWAAVVVGAGFGLGRFIVVPASLTGAGTAQIERSARFTKVAAAAAGVGTAAALTAVVVP